MTNKKSDTTQTENSQETAVKRSKIVETKHIDGVTYSLEYTRCGHANRCKKCQAAYYGHGPYWHGRFWDAKAGKRGRTIGKYIGKTFRELTAAERGQ
ncbi:hypothetical protein V6O07_06580 [Arthrospira platensis SPKY2]